VFTELGLIPVCFIPVLFLAVLPKDCSGRIKTGDCSDGLSELESCQSEWNCAEDGMPYYEYLCGACKKKFSLALSLAEHEQGKAKCPKCGSSKVEQQWAAFYATTSKKS
jgi:putative FmdB family regulatory protein